MIEIKQNAGLVAFCGLYCGACGAYLKGRCPGCAENEKAGWCKIRTCCKEKSRSTCAECGEFADPNDCGKFNNLISKVFAFFFKSDRRACIMQVKELGLAGHAKTMAEMRRQSIKKVKAKK